MDYVIDEDSSNKIKKTRPREEQFEIKFIMFALVFSYK